MDMAGWGHGSTSSTEPWPATCVTVWARCGGETKCEHTVEYGEPK